MKQISIVIHDEERVEFVLELLAALPFVEIAESPEDKAHQDILEKVRKGVNSLKVHEQNREPVAPNPTMLGKL